MLSVIEHISELQPYKYAGYPQLIKTIKLETADDQLFSKSAPLLCAASELAYHTVRCSALNAEELRRENGLEVSCLVCVRHKALYSYGKLLQVLLEAYTRCVNVINNSTKPSETCAQVCEHVTKCYTVAAQFQACREKIIEMPQLVKDLCRILYFKVSGLFAFISCSPFSTSSSKIKVQLKVNFFKRKVSGVVKFLYFIMGRIDPHVCATKNLNSL